jgi:hypothetical protein
MDGAGEDRASGSEDYVGFIFSPFIAFIVWRDWEAKGGLG